MDQVVGVALGLGLLLGMIFRFPALVIAATFSIPVGLNVGWREGLVFLVALSVAYLIGAFSAALVQR